MTIRRHDARLKAESGRTGVESVMASLSTASWASHLVGADEPIEVISRHVAEPDRLLAKRCSICMCRFGDCRRALVADRRCERGDQHQRALHQLTDARLVGADAGNTMLCER